MFSTGGLFLLIKALYEINSLLKSPQHTHTSNSLSHNVALILVQIIALDLVFSLDSVITVVGLVDEIWKIGLSMSIAVIVMIVSATSIANFVEQNARIKLLALSFLCLIGAMLIAYGLGYPINHNIIYSLMFISLLAERSHHYLKSK